MCLWQWLVPLQAFIHKNIYITENFELMSISTSSTEYILIKWDDMASSMNSGIAIDSGIPVQLGAILPSGYNYKLKSFSSGIPCNGEHRFESSLLANIPTKEDACQWLRHFQDLTYTTWRKQWMYAQDTPRIVYKIGYRCHRNTKPKDVERHHEKHTGCKASLWLTINKLTKKKRKDENLKQYPCTITLNHTHNHELYSVESMKHRQPASEIREKFIRLLSEHTPSSAFEFHKRDLQIEHKDNYHKVVADRHLCPDLHWVYYLYYKTLRNGANKDSEAMQNSPELTPSDQAYQSDPVNRVSRIGDEVALAPMETESDELSSKTRKRLHAFFCQLTSDLERETEQLCPAINMFMDTYEKLRTAAERKAAFETFGLCSSSGSVQSSGYVNARSPVVKRTRFLGKRMIGRRKHLTSGRFARSSFTMDHNYVQLKENSVLVPKRSKLAAKSGVSMGKAILPNVTNVTKC